MLSTMLFYCEQPELPQTQTAYLGGAALEYSVVSGRALLSRIISSDPSSFLDGRLFPGADITDLLKYSTKPE